MHGREENEERKKEEGYDGEGREGKGKPAIASTNEGRCLAQCRNLPNVIECQMFPHSSLVSAKTPALQATGVEERDMHSQIATIRHSLCQCAIIYLPGQPYMLLTKSTSPLERKLRWPILFWYFGFLVLIVVKMRLFFFDNLPKKFFP